MSDILEDLLKGIKDISKEIKVNKTDLQKLKDINKNIRKKNVIGKLYGPNNLMIYLLNEEAFPLFDKIDIQEIVKKMEKHGIYELIFVDKNNIYKKVITLDGIIHYNFDAYGNIMYY